jgi:hypothetical protein
MSWKDKARVFAGSCLLVMTLFDIQAALGQRAEIALKAQSFRVSGLADLKSYSGPQLSEVFSISVDAPDVPALAGQYSIDNGELVFVPSYPLGPGMRYRAVLRIPSKEPIVRVFETPARDDTPTTQIEHVYPSANVLPENQLKFYIHFSAPMSRGEAYDRMHLLDASENPVEDVFLELPEELWDKELRRLTVLFDPGRIKTGLVPNLEMGTALRAGKAYTFVIDREWRDAENKRLKERFTKSFTVGPADRKPLDPKGWRLAPPQAATLNPVVLDFFESLDQALLVDQLAVIDAAGNVVPGSAEIRNDETRWQFRPASAWKSGTYAIRVGTDIADLAGNLLGRAFEVDTAAQGPADITPKVQILPFNVQ